MHYQATLRAYREELKGLAILWVVFFHAQLNLSGPLYELQRIGYGGVDLFFFLSGFGLYHSLNKQNGLSGYVSRRMVRLMPSYLPFCLCWLAVMLPMFGLSATQAIRTAAGNLSMLGFWAQAPKMINWYVSALALSLLLAPVIFLSLRDTARPGRRVAAVLAISFAIGLCFIGDERYMAISRLPIFILGMAFAMPDNHQKPNAPAKLAVVFGLSFAIGLAALQLCLRSYPELLNDYGMYWHPFVLITPPLCVGLGWFFHKTAKIHRIYAPLRMLGKASFEIFLFNCWAEVLGKQFGLAWNPVSWGVLSLSSIALGILYHFVVRWCVQRASVRKNRANISRDTKPNP